jgi:hypothetical protein
MTGMHFLISINKIDMNSCYNHLALLLVANDYINVRWIGDFLNYYLQHPLYKFLLHSACYPDTSKNR